MVKKSALPNGIWRTVWPRLFSKNSFERADPATEFEIIAAGDKQMQVIRHDDVTTDSDLVISRSTLRKIDKCVVNLVCRENWSSILNAAGDEICRLR